MTALYPKIFDLHRVFVHSWKYLQRFLGSYLSRP